MTKNWKKITAEKFLFYFFGSKTTIYLSLGLHKERSSYRKSLQFSKEAIHHFKHELLNFLLLLWVIFALLDPDQLTRLNPDPIRIRIRIRIRNPEKYFRNSKLVFKRFLDLYFTRQIFCGKFSQSQRWSSKKRPRNAKLPQNWVKHSFSMFLRSF